LISIVPQIMDSIRLRGVLALAFLCSSICLIDLVRAAAEPGATKVKSSEIIASAGAANLANGNGDVAATGLKKNGFRPKTYLAMQRGWQLFLLSLV
jgi:hypothetical protein